MSASSQVVDCNGRPVTVGSMVRVLAIAEFLARDLPPDEFAHLQTMLGKVFPVTEIDRWGGAWVELEIPVDANHVQSHTLSLAANEMELVSNPIGVGT